MEDEKDKTEEQKNETTETKSSETKKFITRGGQPSEFIEKVVNINRVAKVVKGGRRFAFSVLVIVGNGDGRCGYGLGKAREISEAIRKALIKAKKNMYSIPRRGQTIPHTVHGHFGAAKILLKPAAPGTGVIAGGPVRALCDASGIKDILSKTFGSRNPINVVKAALDGFGQLRLSSKTERVKSED